jgi:PIN domain nuclease of toxin-antitoxin system
VHRAIGESGNFRFLLPVSKWEAIILLEKQKISSKNDFGQFIERTLFELDLQEAPLDWKVAHEVSFALLGYKDPADRFLAATAKVYDLTLVTADEKLLNVPGLRTLANI